MEKKIKSPVLVIFADFGNGSLSNDQMQQTAEVQGYLQANLSVLHVFASDSSSKSVFHEFTATHFLIRRPNKGYDFGSWQAAFDYPEILSRFEYLIFTNSSLLGPLSSPVEFINSLLTLKGDVKAAVESLQIEPHFQSYMWAIENRSLIFKIIEKFLKPFATASPDRESTIKNGELKLPHVLKSHGLTYKTLYPAGSLCEYEKNPSLEVPFRLIASGFPFIKKSLLKSPEFIEQYAVQLREFIPDWPR